MAYVKANLPDDWTPDGEAYPRCPWCAGEGCKVCDHTGTVSPAYATEHAYWLGSARPKE